MRAVPATVNRLPTILWKDAHAAPARTAAQPATNCSTQDRLTELVAPPRTATAVDWPAAEALIWATAGPPEEWPVVLESLATWRHDGPCEDLPLMLLEGTVEVPYIPHESFDDPHGFTPLEAADGRLPTGVLRGIRRLL